MKKIFLVACATLLWATAAFADAGDMALGEEIMNSPPLTHRDIMASIAIFVFAAIAVISFIVGQKIIGRKKVSASGS